MINKFLLKEGERPVLYALLFTVFSSLFLWEFIAVISFLTAVFLLYVFRVPFRSYSNVSDMLSPIDGEVIAIDRLDSKNIVYIQTTLCDAHILRAPIKGSFDVIKNKKGINLNTSSFKAGKLNQNMILQYGNMTLDFLVGRFNILLSLDENKEYEQNEKMGVFTQGLLKITLGENEKAKVKIGQKVYAGITVLA